MMLAILLLLGSFVIVSYSYSRGWFYFYLAIFLIELGYVCVTGAPIL